MSSFEGSYPSLLQGVSQQVARARLPGQLSMQENMLSDPVTGLRRRPGVEYNYEQTIVGATSDSIVAWYTDIAGFRVHVLVDTVTGRVIVRNDDYTQLASLGPSTYLQGTSAGKIRAASVGDSLFIANTDVIPGKTATASKDPAKAGFFYVKASAFSKTYNLTVRNGLGTFQYSYTTPTGANAGDPALATTDYIATQLGNAIQSASNGISVGRVGSYVYLANDTGGGVLSVSTGSGTQYIQTSGAMYVRQETDLPATLTIGADGIIVGTGPEKAMVYYKYSYSDQQWLEVGSYGSPGGLYDMPLELRYNSDTNTWILDETDYEGRYSGNDETNEDPQFLDWGITGLSSFQGRLVILAGSWVSMSAAGKPRRFYRSTVTDLLDADPIHIGSSATSSAAYEYALPFSKDLLLFSSKYQALVPASSTAITPRIAQVVVTSTYAADMTSSPVTLGRTVMYSAPRSADFFGVMEMMPSPYADSQYVSTDSTEHLPKYLGGRCRFSVSSSVASMVLFAPSGDKKSLIVHEYSWSGEEKILRAWHHWTFEYDVAYAYFSGEIINLITVRNGRVVSSVIDPRLGILSDDTTRRPFLDWYTTVTVTDNTATLPAWLVTMLGADVTKIRVSAAAGALGGQEVGATVTGNMLTTVPSFPSGVVYIGVPFFSGFSPTPPSVTDSEGVVISTNKMSILRYHILTKDTAPFDVSVRDTSNSMDPIEYPVNPLQWTSPELQLGTAPVSREGSTILPCRTNADSTSIVISTKGLGELNILALEYVCRFHQRLSRR